MNTQDDSFLAYISVSKKFSEQVLTTLAAQDGTSVISATPAKRDAFDLSLADGILIVSAISSVASLAKICLELRKELSAKRKPVEQIVIKLQNGDFLTLSGGKTETELKKELNDIKRRVGRTSKSRRRA